MNHEHPIDGALRSLIERAKELECLYRVDELLKETDKPLADILKGIVEAIPPGYQFPGVCRARITHRGLVVVTPGFQDTPWIQTAELTDEGEKVGRIEVCYLEQMAPDGEGPFLREEQKLITTIAQHLDQFVQHQRLRTAFHQLEAARESGLTSDTGTWRTIITFLKTTDHQLLDRITRKLLNHLSWIGIPAAVDLLHSLITGSETAAAGEGENWPTEPETLEEPADFIDRGWAVAADHLSNEEIIACVQRWIREDRARFMVNAVSNPDTPLDEVADAVRRFHYISPGEISLSRSMQRGLRVSLIEHFFTDQLSYINTAKRFVDVDEYFDLVTHMIHPPRSFGKLGGKSAGLFLARKILEKAAAHGQRLAGVRVPRTWYLTTDTLMDFVQHNSLQDVYYQKYADLDQIRYEYPHIVQVFKNSQFSPEIVKGLSVALDDLEGRPIIVRSSSLLEDRFGAAFSGKYKSLFLANQGTKQERLYALMDAIAEVYASVFAPDPIEYRMEKDLIDVYEEMGILIQEVVGTRIGPYFLPSFSGVAFSRNEFRWSARIRREDGLVRLVPGLGTRAVDRLKDDYPVLMAPGQPSLRVNVTLDEIIRYSPRNIDVINLETGSFETIGVRDFLEEVRDGLPRIASMVSLVEEDRVRRPIASEVALNPGRLVFTFEGLASGTPFIRQIRTILEILEREMGTPVDIEFASDGEDLYLLQCRPQSSSSSARPAAIPRDVPPGRTIFTARRFVSNGTVQNITHIVYVDPDRYNALPSLEELRTVGRAVGRLNKLLPKHQFILMGPGRWGSRGDIKLGVDVTYSDINNTALLVEIARKKGNYIPDLSFGTHFFQDLVEASIRYLPLYPDDSGIVFNEEFLKSSPNILADLAPEFGHMSDTIRVIDVATATNGLVLHVLMNAEEDEAAAILSMPKEVARDISTLAGAEESRSDNHWRWRLHFAEKIAAEIDPDRFGVKALYIFGSTKNATAGPGSDIDLLIHFAGTEEQREDLGHWLEGWSQCLSEINFLRTGQRTPGILDVHLLTDSDIAEKTSFAAKIGAVTDPARRLPIGPPRGGGEEAGG